MKDANIDGPQCFIREWYNTWESQNPDGEQRIWCFEVKKIISPWRVGRWMRWWQNGLQNRWVIIFWIDGLYLSLSDKKKKKKKKSLLSLWSWVSTSDRLGFWMGKKEKRQMLLSQSLMCPRLPWDLVCVNCQIGWQCLISLKNNNRHPNLGLGWDDFFIWTILYGSFCREFFFFLTDGVNF